MVANIDSRMSIVELCCVTACLELDDYNGLPGPSEGLGLNRSGQAARAEEISKTIMVRFAVWMICRAGTTRTRLVVDIEQARW